MAVLKQSTTYTRMFLMVDSSDHFTGKTGLTVTVTLSKAGGAFAAAGGTITEVSSGWYKIALTTTDTNTLGDLSYHCTSTGADATDFVDQVTTNILGDTLPANVLSINSVSASSVTAVNANIGTTQPVNYTGTGASALVKSDMVDIAGAAVSTSTAQLGVNVVNWGGSAVPATNVAGVPLVDLKYTLGTISPAAAGYVAVDWAHIANPTTVIDLSGTSIASLDGGATVSGTVTLSAGERNSIADALLDRDMSLGADNGSSSVRTPRQALRSLRNKWAVQSSTLTVYKEDDTTASWTSTLATTANTNPVTSSDPAGP